MALRSGLLFPACSAGPGGGSPLGLRAAGNSRLPAAEHLKRLGAGLGAGLRGSAPPLASLRSANQSSVFDKRASRVVQLALGMPRGTRVDTMGVQRNQSTTPGANS